MAGSDKAPQPLDLEQLRTSLAAEGHPWQMATTTMTMLTEEQRRMRLGVPLPPEPDVARLLEEGGSLRAVASATAASIGAPASFDARNVGGANYVTGVRDQGSCGSCVSFGTVATMETTAALTRGVPSMKLDLSEAHLFYVQGAGEASCGGGWHPASAWPKLANTGVTFEDYMPYTPGNSGGATLNADWQNRLAKAGAVTELTGDIGAIKAHLASKGAVSACFLVYQDFYSYRSGVYRHVTGSDPGGHCVALVGYDDAQGCWIAKNSWGAGWGDGGFFRIAYGECGIDTWHVAGTDRVSLRAWTGYSKVVGLWSNSAARNAWAYLDANGWVKLDGGADVTTTAMLAEAVAAKTGSRQINAFVDNGTLNELYVL